MIKDIQDKEIKVGSRITWPIFDGRHVRIGEVLEVIEHEEEDWYSKVKRKRYSLKVQPKLESQYYHLVTGLPKPPVDVSDRPTVRITNIDRVLVLDG